MSVEKKKRREEEKRIARTQSSEIRSSVAIVTAFLVVLPNRRAMENVVKDDNLQMESSVPTLVFVASGTQPGDSTSSHLIGTYPHGASEGDEINSSETYMPSMRLTSSASGDSHQGSTARTGKHVPRSDTPYKVAQIGLLSSHPEVYDPCDDSFALVDALLADRLNLIQHQPSICMEIGCGSGYVITSLALILGRHAALYIATDINPNALLVTSETLEAHGCKVEVVNTDIANGFKKRLSKSVDVIVVNPPYVPTPEDEVGCDGITSAWAGGENGRTVIDRILPVADELLSEKGWLYMVTLVANNPLELCLEMRKKGFGSRIILQRSTEEESLQVIKFWRDSDIRSEIIEGGNGCNTKTFPFNPFSGFWKRSNC